jgi:putative heme iron utilization protein
MARAMTATTAPTNHDAPADALAVPAPLVAIDPARRRTPAEEARALVAANGLGTLSTLAEDGGPWGSLVAYATINAGEPVLLVSTLAEHGRNLPRDPRASLVISSDERVGGDPLNSGRVTLAGRCEQPVGDELAAAREAFLAAVPMARHYIDFGDFSLYVLRVDRVRWVGGYGRMDSADAASYAAAEVDPVVGQADYATRHLNEDHADALLEIAQKLSGYTDATAARADRCDRYGIDLTVTTPRGKAPTRVAWLEPIAAADGLRAASVALVRHARTI